MLYQNFNIWRKKIIILVSYLSWYVEWSHYTLYSCISIHILYYYDYCLWDSFSWFLVLDEVCKSDRRWYGKCYNDLELMVISLQDNNLLKDWFIVDYFSNFKRWWGRHKKLMLWNKMKVNTNVSICVCEANPPSMFLHLSIWWLLTSNLFMLLSWVEVSSNNKSSILTFAWTNGYCFSFILGGNDFFFTCHTNC